MDWSNNSDDTQKNIFAAEYKKMRIYYLAMKNSRQTVKK